MRLGDGSYKQSGIEAEWSRIEARKGLVPVSKLSGLVLRLQKSVDTVDLCACVN